jgi:hypothetical protein
VNQVGYPPLRRVRVFAQALSPATG